MKYRWSINYAKDDKGYKQRRGGDYDGFEKAYAEANRYLNKLPNPYEARIFSIDPKRIKILLIWDKRSGWRKVE